MKTSPPYASQLSIYATRFRVRRGEDHLYTIRGRYARIVPWQLRPTTRLGLLLSARSPRHLTGLMKTATAALQAHKPVIWQEGDTEAVLAFENSFSALKALANAGLIYWKRGAPHTPPTEVRP